MTPLSRRQAVKLGIGSLAAMQTASRADEPAQIKPRSFLTPVDDFEDVSRGTPKPHTLTGEALLNAKLTPETWKLEISADETTNAIVTQKAQIGKAVTLDYAALLELGQKHRVRFLKAMQCLNIAAPLGQGLWEGVPLRDVLRLCGAMSNVRRVYFWGFHNDDPKQRFQSSLSYTQVMETPPAELPVFLAYKLNGEPINLERGGPVRMVVPWAHGFKSIKWLQHIRLTNDYQANDTYAEKNNDPESHLKTAAYLDDVVVSGKMAHIGGWAISGLSGLSHVETWLRPAGTALAENDPEWEKADWKPAPLDPPPDWKAVLPKEVIPQSILGFDPASGKPLTWPLRYSMVGFSTVLRDLKPGKYEVRARTVDLNGFAQPEPRSIQKSGKNGIQVRAFTIA
ncbi:MAG: molybdopterin-dependent oxidoreductase [Verrucomicrobiaceae bacterium]|nr:molybdopterin-dependent oxidoreductase [Verrucomicrobiaceae bacterium]